MQIVHDILIRKLTQHRDMYPGEIAGIRSLPATIRNVPAGDDIVRQGDRPTVSVVVLSGMVGRYHTLGGGVRQYLSFHITGDMPDAQGLFLSQMDHSICAVGEATIAMVPHKSIIAMFEGHPTLGSAIWRETLIDAAIFREAITNNGSRPVTVRLAHFLSEQYYRACAVGLNEDNCCDLPLSQTQLAEALASSLTTINRSMQVLRKKTGVELKAGRLCVKNWKKLSVFGDFDPLCLHLRRPPLIN